MVKSIPNANIMPSKTLVYMLNNQALYDQNGHIFDPFGHAMRSTGIKDWFTKAIHKYVLDLPNDKSVLLLFVFVP